MAWWYLPHRGRICCVPKILFRGALPSALGDEERHTPGVLSPDQLQEMETFLEFSRSLGVVVHGFSEGLDFQSLPGMEDVPWVVVYVAKKASLSRVRSLCAELSFPVDVEVLR